MVLKGQIRTQDGMYEVENLVTINGTQQGQIEQRISTINGTQQGQIRTQWYVRGTNKKPGCMYEVEDLVTINGTQQGQIGTPGWYVRGREFSHINGTNRDKIRTQ
ncbi:Hypothetical predicted protein, partial [Mytilus galloprovincialis]